MHDRAQIFINGEYKEVLERWDIGGMGKKGIPVPLEKGQSLQLDILVENMGRVNYGNRIRKDRKGIDCVHIDV